MKIFNINSDKLDYEFKYNDSETQLLKAENYLNLSRSDLFRIALWKIDRVINVPDDLLLELRNLSKDSSLQYDSDFSIDIIKKLVSCDGVGYPMASTFLKFIRPDIYPIIDVRSLRALTGKKFQYYQYNIKLYLWYTEELMKIAKLHKLKLHQVDEQLYEFDKKFNGNIKSSR